MKVEAITMNKWKLLALASAMPLTLAFAGPKVTVIGDSYSAYLNLSYGQCDPAYPTSYTTYVNKPDQMYWGRVINKLGGTLERLNGWNASYVNIGDYDRSFISNLRLSADYLGDADLFIICGGTNDSWSNVSLGDDVDCFNEENWTDANLHKFRPAYAYLVNYLCSRYPHSEVMVVINSCDDGLKGINPLFCTAMAEIAEHYNVVYPGRVMYAQTHDVVKNERHPTCEGMYAMSEQVLASYYGRHPEAAVPPRPALQYLPTSQFARYASVQGSARVLRTGDGLAYVFTDAASAASLTASVNLGIRKALIVGGGGGGTAGSSSAIGLGGAGGEVREISASDLPNGGQLAVGGTVAVTVGAGGTGGANGTASSLALGGATLTAAGGAAGQCSGNGTAATANGILGGVEYFGGGGGAGTSSGAGVTVNGVGGANAGDGAENVAQVVGRNARDGFGGGGGGGGYCANSLGPWETAGGKGGSGMVVLLVNLEGTEPVMTVDRVTRFRDCVRFDVEVDPMNRDGVTYKVEVAAAKTSTANDALEWTCLTTAAQPGWRATQVLSGLEGDAAYDIRLRTTPSDGVAYVSSGAVVEPAAGSENWYSDDLIATTISQTDVSPVMTASGRICYSFRNLTPGEVLLKQTVMLDALLSVGGGGAGGNVIGGGGGGGQVIARTWTLGQKMVGSSDEIEICVGAGGSPSAVADWYEPGHNGEASHLKLGNESYDAIGGGGGASFRTGSNGSAISNDGASGGGSASWNSHGGGQPRIPGVTGYAGGNVYNQGGNDAAPGGGGGAGEAGANGTAKQAGRGGEGVVSAIAGTEQVYGSGGGGGCGNGVKSAAGGTNAGSGAATANDCGEPGVDGYGGGGGGGGFAGGTTGYAGGRGGNGVVILSFSEASDPAGSVTFAGFEGKRAKVNARVEWCGPDATTVKVLFGCARQGAMPTAWDVLASSASVGDVVPGVTGELALGGSYEIFIKFANAQGRESVQTCPVQMDGYEDENILLLGDVSGFEHSLDASGSAIYRFAAARDYTATFKDEVSIERALLVGGGGAGGLAQGGGGGGGQVLRIETPLSAAIGQVLSVTVGAGGVPSATGVIPFGDGSAWRAPGGCGQSSWMRIGDGQASEAIGGGGGASYRTGEAGSSISNGYASGGGAACYCTNGGGQPRTVGVTGYAGGNVYGQGENNAAPGGGGGAGEPGADAQYAQAGRGGNGENNDITGTYQWYGSGGGGGGRGNSSNPEVRSADGGTNAGCGRSDAAGTPGLDGFGGGGGGGGCLSNYGYPGGAGGCGTVIVKVRNLAKPVCRIVRESATMTSAKLSVEVLDHGLGASSTVVDVACVASGTEPSRYERLSGAAELGVKLYRSYLNLVTGAQYDLCVKLTNDKGVERLDRFTFTTMVLPPEYVGKYEDERFYTTADPGDFILTTVGDEVVYAFVNATKDIKLMSKGSVSLTQSLVVGGGGAGGNTLGGGGGGGQVLPGGAYGDVPSGQEIVLHVGAGGSPNVPVECGMDAHWHIPGGNGLSSWFSVNGGILNTAIGGGGGASFRTGSNGTDVSNEGASGGGAAYYCQHGGGQAVCGNPGGNHYSQGDPWAPGGGGGAGEAGANGSYDQAGRGGEGVGNAITGTEQIYGSGGGGGCGNGVRSASGGANAGSGAATRDDCGEPGLDGFGGGGGGGGFAGGTAGRAGGRGGNGAVILRVVKTAPPPSPVYEDETYYLSVPEGQITFDRLKDGDADVFVLSNPDQPVTMRFKQPVVIQSALVVGGGGAGGGVIGGGGGGGQVLPVDWGTTGLIADSTDESFLITVGAGGLPPRQTPGLPTPESPDDDVWSVNGGNGQTSSLVIGNVTHSALGGGGGGSFLSIQPVSDEGASGGGGGSISEAQSGGQPKGESTGHAGGDCVSTTYPGGGGGAGSVGDRGNTKSGCAGAGGEGLPNSITGTFEIYGAGGGGGGGNAANPATGGTHGGAGGTKAGDDTSFGGAGADGYGAGGGGGGYGFDPTTGNGLGYPGGRGGNGAVILRIVPIGDLPSPTAVAIVDHADGGNSKVELKVHATFEGSASEFSQWFGLAKKHGRIKLVHASRVSDLDTAQPVAVEEFPQTSDEDLAAGNFWIVVPFPDDFSGGVCYWKVLLTE